MCGDPSANPVRICAGLAKLIRPNTKLVICAHASNICSYSLPIREIGAFCKRHGILFAVDAAQSAGHLPIDVIEMNIDALCAPGHKALFGLAGCGFLIFNDGLEREPLIEGGSGNMSLSTSMPENLPERFEAGTLPCPSIISLNEGIKFIEKITLEEINSKIESLSSELYARLERLPKISLYGYGNGVLPFNIGSLPSEAVAEELNRDGICTRAGLHCAPSVHKLLGTLQNGAIRVSFSYFNSKRDVDLLYKSVKRIIGTI
jgi:selenocysteine lyase/cysteine desulfurase